MMTLVMWAEGTGGARGQRLAALGILGHVGRKSAQRGKEVGRVAPVL